MTTSIAAPGPRKWGNAATGFAIVFGVVFAASMFGILTRPAGFLAAVWPANALLLGLMIRWPRLGTLPNWVAAFLAYVAADMMTGGTLLVTLWLTAANMIGALTGYVLFRQVPSEDRALRRPQSVLVLTAICCGASLAASVSGAGVAHVLFGRDLLKGLEFWLVTELVNNLVILPLVLTWPTDMAGSWTRRTAASPFPAAALLVSAAAAVLIGGPGAVVFAVPALIWCALTYDMFTTSALTMVFCTGLLAGTSSGLVALPVSPDDVGSTSSLRLGIALMALGPLTVGSINRVREELLALAAHTADHDSLTSCLSRKAFIERGEASLADAFRLRRPVALLMLDLDHFKAVNDRFGHAAGDAVLIEFASRVRPLLREHHIFGRLGGEEFAIVAPGSDLRAALALGEEIRTAVALTSFVASADRTIQISTSVGVSVEASHSGATLATLLVSADAALYRAKTKGRNRVLAAA